MNYTHIIVGGGTAGCVLANRISANPDNNVLLIEAGPDFGADGFPADIRDIHALRAFMNPGYFWPELRVRRTTHPEVQSEYFGQAKLIGGGSSINGQVAVRGAPRDFDRWEELGATGWGWDQVLPYFKKLESDLDCHDNLHGRDGPIRIRRVPQADWDDFTNATVATWLEQGFRFLPDMNGDFGEGFSPLPLSNDGVERNSTATGYLTSQVRARKNLSIWAETTVHRIITRNGIAVGVECKRGGERLVATGGNVVVAAGAMHTPKLLMLSGIGQGLHLQKLGLPVICDRPGVGQNLQDHPTISIAAYLPSHVRNKRRLRRNYTYLRYSSHERNCPDNDMVMMSVCQTGWHAVGQRLGTLSTYIGKSYSRGEVKLGSPDPAVTPEVHFNCLSDERDLSRMMTAFRGMAGTFVSATMRASAYDPFPVSFSDRVRRVGRPTLTNTLMTGMLGKLLDAPGPVRRFLVQSLICDGPSLTRLMTDEGELRHYVQTSVTTSWHPCGSCRMGWKDDPMSVVDSQGRVLGIGNLWIADASVIPEITTTNTNLPVIMVAEKISDHLLAERKH